MKYLILLFPIICFAEKYDLTPNELNILKKAATLAPVEPWDPKRQYPPIVDEKLPQPPPRYIQHEVCSYKIDILGNCVNKPKKGKKHA